MNPCRRRLYVSVPLLVLWTLIQGPVPRAQDAAAAGAYAKSEPLTAAELVRGGPAPDLEILFTAEARGFYQPCG